MAESESAALSAILSAARKGRSRELGTLAARLRDSDPFAWSALRDVLESAAEASGGGLVGAARRWAGAARGPQAARGVIEARIASLGHWRREGNETIAAIVSGTIDPAAIKPHVRHAAEDYDRFYREQDRDARPRAAARAAHAGEVPDARRPVCRPERIGANLNHSLRKGLATRLVELVFGYVEALEAPDEVAWLDIACGTGQIANATDPTRYGARGWSITGADLQTSRISDARVRAARGRRFEVADAFDLLAAKAAAGERFHIVSMFEFLEHLEDPLALLRRVAAFGPSFVVAGSPLAQKLERPDDRAPDRSHLWSFSREAWEQMFRAAGLEPVISSETRVGSYVGGLDWLSMVSGPKALLESRRQSLQAGRPAQGTDADE